MHLNLAPMTQHDVAPTTSQTSYHIGSLVLYTPVTLAFFLFLKHAIFIWF